MTKEQLIEFVEAAHKNKVLNLFLVSLITSENTDEQKKVALDLAKRLVECADEINLPKTVKARIKRCAKKTITTLEIELGITEREEPKDESKK